MIEVLVIFTLLGLVIMNAIHNAIITPEREHKIKEAMAKHNAEVADAQRRDKESREQAVKEFNTAYRAWILTNPSFEQIERFKFQAAIRLKLAYIENALNQD